MAGTGGFLLQGFMPVSGSQEAVLGAWSLRNGVIRRHTVGGAVTPRERGRYTAGEAVTPQERCNERGKQCAQN